MTAERALGGQARERAALEAKRAAEMEGRPAPLQKSEVERIVSEYRAAHPPERTWKEIGAPPEPSWKPVAEWRRRVSAPVVSPEPDPTTVRAVSEWRAGKPGDITPSTGTQQRFHIEPYDPTVPRALTGHLIDIGDKEALFDLAAEEQRMRFAGGTVRGGVISDMSKILQTDAPTIEEATALEQRGEAIGQEVIQYERDVGAHEVRGLELEGKIETGEATQGEIEAYNNRVAVLMGQRSALLPRTESHNVAVDAFNRSIGTSNQAAYIRRHILPTDIGHMVGTLPPYLRAPAEVAIAPYGFVRGMTWPAEALGLVKPAPSPFGVVFSAGKKATGWFGGATQADVEAAQYLGQHPGYTVGRTMGEMFTGKYLFKGVKWAATPAVRHISYGWKLQAAPAISKHVVHPFQRHVIDPIRRSWYASNIGSPTIRAARAPVATRMGEGALRTATIPVRVSRDALGKAWLTAGAAKGVAGRVIGKRAIRVKYLGTGQVRGPWWYKQLPGRIASGVGRTRPVMRTKLWLGRSRAADVVRGAGDRYARFEGFVDTRATSGWHTIKRHFGKLGEAGEAVTRKRVRPGMYVDARGRLLSGIDWRTAHGFAPPSAVTRNIAFTQYLPPSMSRALPSLPPAPQIGTLHFEKFIPSGMFTTEPSAQAISMGAAGAAVRRPSQITQPFGKAGPRLRTGWGGFPGVGAFPGFVPSVRPSTFDLSQAGMLSLSPVKPGIDAIDDVISTGGDKLGKGPGVLPFAFPLIASPPLAGGGRRGAGFDWWKKGRKVHVLGDPMQVMMGVKPKQLTYRVEHFQTTNPFGVSKKRRRKK